jgi:hypothetical protein
VLAEQPDRVSVVSRRPHPSAAQMCWATSTHASMAVTNVYFTPLSQMGSSRRLSSAVDSRLSTETSSVMLRKSRRTRSVSTTGLPGPGGDRGSELPVSTGNPRQLVRVDLPRHRFPADPRGLIFLEEESSAKRDPPGQLQRRVF